jgi:hypothetical protein
MLCKDTFTHILLRPREKKSRIIESHFYLMTDVMVVGVERGKKYFLSAVLPLEHCATEIVDTKIDSTCVGMCAHPRLTNSRHSLPIILFDGLAFTHSLTLSLSLSLSLFLHVHTLWWCSGRDVEHVLKIFRTDTELIWGESGFLIIFQNHVELEHWFRQVNQAIADAYAASTCDE